MLRQWILKELIVDFVGDIFWTSLSNRVRRKIGGESGFSSPTWKEPGTDTVIGIGLMDHLYPRGDGEHTTWPLPPARVFPSPAFDRQISSGQMFGR